MGWASSDAKPMEIAVNASSSHEERRLEALKIAVSMIQAGVKPNGISQPLCVCDVLDVAEAIKFYFETGCTKIGPSGALNE